MNEHQRHVKARQDILSGKTPDKRIFVHMEDLEEKKKREEEIKSERERKSNRSDALKEARTPWFCPECKKVMKKRLDDKMYRLHNHCFDCQVKFENKLRKFIEKKQLRNEVEFVGRLGLGEDCPKLKIFSEGDYLKGFILAKHQN